MVRGREDKREIQVDRNRKVGMETWRETERRKEEQMEV